MLMRKFQQLGKNEWGRREKAELLNECRHACLNKQVSTQDCSTTERWNRIFPGSIPTHSKRWLGRKMLWKPYLHRRFNRTLKAFNIARISPTDQPIRCPCDHPESKNNVLVFFLFLLLFLLVLLFSIPLFPLSFLPFLLFCVPPSLLPSFSKARSRKDSISSVAIQLQAHYLLSADWIEGCSTAYTFFFFKF